MICEVCVDSVPAALAAERGGADRIELCDALDRDGLTPAMSLLHDVQAETSLPIMAMLRPRDGDFCYRPDEFDRIVRAADTFAAAGVAGFAVGALTPAGSIHLESLALLRQRFSDLELTFHRAFDLVPSALAALDQLITLGVDRILTSGGAKTAD
ncbi:MAG TPA: copper homeostasis protein CutC, partial [Pirellulaceae bacterium]